MKLISMTDFVLEQSQKIEDLHDNLCCAIAYNKIENYANFLKQPLELGMFVPCDEDGNLFSEFQLEILNSNDEVYELRKVFQQAKERCLFEGFKLDTKYLWLKNSLFMICDDFNESFKKYGIIEDLLNKYLTKDIELTQTAIKQIGL